MIGISETQDKVRVVRSYRLANEAKKNIPSMRRLTYLGFRSAGKENKCANSIKFKYVKVIKGGNRS